MKRYTQEMEHFMNKYYNSLSESERRRYAAVEAMKLEHGGQKYICEILGCDPDTVLRGIEELKSDEPLLSNRTRVLGGGRKKNT